MTLPFVLLGSFDRESPDIAWEETETSGRIRDRLTDLGLSWRECAGTGTVAGDAAEFKGLRTVFDESERSGGDHVAGEGHAHVYVDGEKIARLYGPWLHIPSLSPGAVVEVTLNANDHRPLAIGSGRIADRVGVPRD